MRIYQDLSEVSHNKNSVVTLGTFDGVHLGHRKIIDEVVKKAALLGGRSFLVTFYPHPRKIISRENKIELLNTPSEKVKMIESFGIENMLIIKFTKEFSQLDPDKFLEKYIVDGIGAREVVIGYDHHFGKGRGGDINSLKKKGYNSGFEVTVIPACNIDGVVISSSNIRKAISEGDIKRANKFIGRFYSFGGKVIRGDKRGRELGFPTANLDVENNDKLLPAIGIYAVEFIVKEKKHFGLLSVGKRPTFYASGDIVPEVYIYDFDENIYDEFVTVNVVERIRGEEKFSSADELVKQMNNDKKIGIEILKKLNN
ncbi:MAG: bifunctional riboflavin kinase/FAD synthetase [Bacteroidetes bacterium]|nr:bifunctional riboflavin kinase/FAD synthetase [Bacteroidota bacterium]